MYKDSGFYQYHLEIWHLQRFVQDQLYVRHISLYLSAIWLLSRAGANVKKYILIHINIGRVERERDNDK